MSCVLVVLHMMFAHLFRGVAVVSLMKFKPPERWVTFKRSQRADKHC